MKNYQIVELDGTKNTTIQAQNVQNAISQAEKLGLDVNHIETKKMALAANTKGFIALDDNGMPLRKKVYKKASTAKGEATKAKKKRQAEAEAKRKAEREKQAAFEAKMLKKRAKKLADKLNNRLG